MWSNKNHSLFTRWPWSYVKFLELRANVREPAGSERSVLWSGTTAHCLSFGLLLLQKFQYMTYIHFLYHAGILVYCFVVCILVPSSFGVTWQMGYITVLSIINKTMHIYAPLSTPNERILEPVIPSSLVCRTTVHRVFTRCCTCSHPVIVIRRNRRYVDISVKPHGGH